MQDQNEKEIGMLADEQLFGEEGSSEESGRGRGKPGDGKAEESMEMLSGIITRMGLALRVTIREDGERIILDVDGNDAGRAIGKKGQTLDALQFLINKMMNRTSHGRRFIVVDSGDYRERHDEQLIHMAKREAKKAMDSGRIITLEPMPARDRRVIHLSLAKFNGVSTKSNGEGSGRRIQIIPQGARRKPQGGGTGYGGAQGYNKEGRGNGGGNNGQRPRTERALEPEAALILPMDEEG